MDVLIGKVARELAALEEQMDRALERTFGSGMQLARGGDSFRPAIDVYDTADATIVRVEIAGVRSSDIQLVVDGQYLQIRGRRHPAQAPAPQHHLQMEIPQGQFERVVRLERPFDPERVRASLKEGILTVELARNVPAKRHIPVEPA